MLLQAITIEDSAYEVEKSGRSFVSELMFPAGCLPSVDVLSGCAGRAAGMRVLDLDDITEGYPETLRRWADELAGRRAGSRAARLRSPLSAALGLLLRWSEGGLRERRIQDVQMLLAKPAYRGSRVNMRPEMASTKAAGPREASLASASLPPGPST